MQFLYGKTEKFIIIKIHVQREECKLSIMITIVPVSALRAFSLVMYSPNNLVFKCCRVIVLLTVKYSTYLFHYFEYYLDIWETKIT